MMSNELKPPERCQRPAWWGHTLLPVAAWPSEVGAVTQNRLAPLSHPPGVLTTQCCGEELSRLRALGCLKGCLFWSRGQSLGFKSAVSPFINSFVHPRIQVSKKVSLKLNYQKTKIMASGPITSWQIDREAMETMTDFIFLVSKNHCRW